ncbi:protein-export chaperone SecB [Actinoplanes aureus]|uniref:Protein-export chaperone SecB n=1 Tax=Actinoplanes aureus TaxID=2792083 RepID=A0A931C3A4_9ACTN|nr:protein-export chaperone SecB [Actinoplanes aureus]MBG0562595.1 protein-export chaperone SecB [Actinoplanes aureus]
MISDGVAAKSSIVDLRMTHLSTDLLVRSPVRPLSVGSQVVIPVISRASDGVFSYHATYELDVRDHRDRKVLNATITMSAVFQIADESVSDAALQAFAEYGALDVVHPYMREILHNLTNRMGIPSLLLDVKPPLGSRLRN